MDKSLFTPDQLIELEAGENAQIDVSVYAKPEYVAIQMQQIRLGLEHQLDVSFYADPVYDWFQMEEIRLGLEENLDVSTYAKPEIPYRKMRQVRLALLDGFDVGMYMHFPAGVIKEIFQAKKNGYDITDYATMGFEAEQLQQIRIAMERNVNLKPYLKKEFRGCSLEEIRRGLEMGVDVSSYAKVEYGWRQMYEIRKGLEKRLDVEKYINPLYTHKQMHQIRKGLESGIPVDEYRLMRFSATDMREKRLELEKKMSSAEKLVVTDFDTIQKAIEEAKQKNDAFHIVVSSDQMEAYLVINDPNSQVTEDEILKEIWDQKIRKGILRREIKKALDGTYTEDTILVACGQSPRAGKDGWYEFFFRTDFDAKPVIMEDGTVDYQNVEWFDTVKEGQKVAYYHPAEEGVDGYNVYGDVISAKKGVEKPVMRGSGYSIDADKCTYRAIDNGVIMLLPDGSIQISAVLEVDNVNVATGNVKFSKNIHIHGDVGNGVSIEAGGDVIVDGFVEGAEIRAEGDILLRNGMSGSDRGKLYAGGKISGRFLERVKAHAKGTIELNYSLNSDLFSEEIITIDGANSSVVGGTLMAVENISLRNVGNKLGNKTEIKAGFSASLMQSLEENAQTIKGVLDELRILNNAKADFVHKYSAEQRAEITIYNTIENAIFTKNRQMEELQQQKKSLTERLQQLNLSTITVSGQLYEGVHLEIAGKHMESMDCKGVVFRRRPGENSDGLLIGELE